MSNAAGANKRRIEQEMLSREVQVRGAPYYYQIHIYMPCNLKCIMCKPNGRHSKDFIPFEEFQLIFDRIKDHAERITLLGGETLVYPWINEALSLLATRPIGVTIITNATRLDDELCERLVQLHDLELRCSVDAATADTYFRIRGADVFDKVTENVRKFARHADGRPNIKQIMVYVVMRKNFHEVLDFVDYCRPLNPHRVQFQPVRHTETWVVSNRTGWTFDGREQSCESFRDEYNRTMSDIESKGRSLGIKIRAYRV